MNASLTLTWTETKLLFREPAAVFFTLIFPLMLLFIFGSIFGNDPEGGWYGRGAMDLTVPGYFGMILGTVGLLSMPIVISEYRSHGIFRRLRATPLNPISIIAAHSSINLLLSLAGFALLFVGGKIFYDLMSPVHPFQLVFAIVLSYAAIASFGFVIGSAFKTSRTAQIAGNVIYFPQLFLSGASFPREMFSDDLRAWTEWMPMTQIVKLIKEAWLGNDLSLATITYLVVMTILSSAVAIKVFRWE